MSRATKTSRRERSHSFDPDLVSRSQQALKSERTRSELLRAAEVIFARDGFEAGRSRGAFYANFDSKTEVFLALRSLATRRNARALRDRIEHVLDPDERYQAITRYILEQICDTQTQLLQIEFKLFALRHPEMLPELAEKHLEASRSVNRQELSDLFPEENMNSPEKRSDMLAVEAILEGFALNVRFSPNVLDAFSIQRLVPPLLETIFHRSRGMITDGR
jgi:AcrR family transcriptional regulator